MDKYKQKGFEGFYSIKELQNNSSLIPKKMGIYYVLNVNNINPKFLKKHKF